MKPWIIQGLTGRTTSSRIFGHKALDEAGSKNRGMRPSLSLELNLPFANGVQDLFRAAIERELATQCHIRHYTNTPNVTFVAIATFDNLGSSIFWCSLP
jgi:hypothetical protein